MGATSLHAGTDRPERRRLPLVVALAAAALVVTLVVAATWAQPNVLRTAASSDGLRAEPGSTIVSNLMVLSAGAGEPGTVLGAVANDGEESTTVSIGLAGSDPATRFEVAPGATVFLGPDDHRVRLGAVPEPPGAVVPLRVTAGEDETVRRVPVLDDTFERYEGLVPAG